MLDLKLTAKNVILTEIEGLNKLLNIIDDNFIKVINEIFKLKGKLIISGVGKSGLIAKKIAATLSSTGTPAFYIHPTESLHGDLGVINKDDCGIFLSYSGETEEILKLVSVFKRRALKIISFTAKLNSTLSLNSDYTLLIPINKEACPMNIVPTASTTAMLALGDALAITLLVKKGFSEKDFAELHPGGNLGNKLLVKVANIMHKGSRIPKVYDSASMKTALIEMSSKKLGVTGVVDKNNNLLGIITDGDLRRHLEKSKTFLEDNVIKVMTKNPKVVDKNILVVEAIKIMEEYKITHLFVVNDVNAANKKIEGVLHIHSVLEEKIL